MGNILTEKNALIYKYLCAKHPDIFKSLGKLPKRPRPPGNPPNKDNIPSANKTISGRFSVDSRIKNLVDLFFPNGRSDILAVSINISSDKYDSDKYCDNIIHNISVNAIVKNPDYEYEKEKHILAVKRYNAALSTYKDDLNTYNSIKNDNSSLIFNAINNHNLLWVDAAHELYRNNDTEPSHLSSLSPADKKHRKLKLIKELAYFDISGE
jgi:hypothetical protein